MALSASDQAAVLVQIIQKLFLESNQTAIFTNTDLAAAITATDNWIDAAPNNGVASNLLSFNAALPLPFRTSATTAQKSIVLAAVALRRGGAASLL